MFMQTVDGEIEQIETGHGDIKLFGRLLFKETPDVLCLSNGKGQSMGALQFLALSITGKSAFLKSNARIILESDRT